MCELTSGRRAQWQVTSAERQPTGGLQTSVWDQLSGGRPGGTMLGRVGALVNKSWSESERSARPPGCNPNRRGGRQVRRREAGRVSRLACYWLDHPGVTGSGEMEELDWSQATAHNANANCEMQTHTSCFCSATVPHHPAPYRCQTSAALVTLCCC